MSKRIDHALKVYQVWRQSILDQLDQVSEMSVEEADAMVNQACKVVAEQEGIQAGTVVSQMTRELDVTISELRQMMMEHLTGEKKRYSDFSNHLCKHCCKDDRESAIRDQLESC